MTMASSMAATVSPWCPPTITNTCQASNHVQESIASKPGTRNIDSASSPEWSVLCEIPTRISLTSPAAAVVELFQDNDGRYQPQTLPPSPTNLDTTTTTLMPLALLCDNDNSFDHRLLLKKITAECKRMQQRWPSIIKLICQGRCDVKPVDSSPSISLSPAELYPSPTNTNLTYEDVPRRSLLANLTAECEWMQQRWPSIIELISQGCCNVEFVTPSPSINLSPPAELCPRPTNTNLTTANISCNLADINTTTDLTILLE